MKVSAAAVSLSVLVASSVGAAHISDLDNLRRQDIERRDPGAAFSSGIKRGLSFNDASLTHDFNSGQVSWAYNWDSSYSGTLPGGVTYIPMLWGTSSDHTDQWSANANAAIQNGAGFLLGFNEPDESSQSNLTPAEAADAWRTYMEPFAGKAKLVSPAITNGAAPMGETWLSEFLSACSGCTIDAIAMHIYDSATNEGYYQSDISGLASKYGKPVWVTEFGATGSTAQQESFLSSMVEYLDGLDGVAAYAWFMDEVGNLVNSDGSLTALANAYVDNN